LGGGGRESPVKHRAKGANRGGGGQQGGARAGKDWAGGSSTSALCTRFTLVRLIKP